MQQKPGGQAAPANVVEMPRKDAPQPRVSAVVDLPSRGRFYGGACPDGTVEVYPMTGRDEALVANMDASEVIDVFDVLLKRCLKTQIDVDDMLSTDKFYLILKLRANSYGSHYEFRARCPNCGLFQATSCEVPDDFNVTYFDSEENEPFEVTLPVSGRKVGFRLLRGKDERDVLKWRNREMERLPKNMGDPAHAYRMAKHIVTIDGKEPANPGEAMRFFEELIARDASTIQNAVDKKVSGVNTEIPVTCGKCKTNFRIDMPFTGGFFRAQERSS